jgi:Fasciclin domain
MDGLKTILAVFTFIALFSTGAGAQFPGMDMQGMQGMDSPWGMDMGMMGQSYGGMFPGMPFGGTVEYYRAPAMETSGKSLAATLESVPQLSLFTAALKATGYADKLNGKGDYIVFAPPDQAIQRDLAVKDVESLLADAHTSRGLVENGVVLSHDDPVEGSSALSLTAASGRLINTRKEKTGMAANGADVIKIFKTANGYIIVTDGAVGI